MNELEKLHLKSKVFPFNLRGITIFKGNLGEGKSLTATFFAYLYHKILKEKIYANYKLNFPYEPITTVEKLKKIQNGLLIIDEAYTLFDSRRSASSKNILNTELIRKSRKKNITTFVISQLFGLVDLRIRYLANHVISVKTVKWKIRNDMLSPDLIELKIFENREGMFILKEIKYLKPLDFMFNLFDSFEDVFSVE